MMCHFILFFERADSSRARSLCIALSYIQRTVPICMYLSQRKQAREGEGGREGTGGGSRAADSCSTWIGCPAFSGWGEGRRGDVR